MRILVALGFLGFLGFGAMRAAVPRAALLPPPPPPAPPHLSVGPVPSVTPGPGAVDGTGAALAAGLPLWSIGDPSDDEQWLLELVNRARANPAAEAERLIQLDNPYATFAYGYYRVDLDVFRNAMLQFQPAPPLAFHPLLSAAALGHSQWMLANAEQSHFQGDVTLEDRINATGYPWSGLGESVYAAGYDMEHVHAAFEVDWGLFDDQGNPVSPGMQEPPGHRLSNHDASYREVGISVVDGTNSRLVGTNLMTVGPKVVTVDFGSRPGAQPLVTGVAFLDLDGDAAYGPGEGIPNVEVTVSGATHRALTARSGGYAVPVADGSRTLVFAVPGMAPVQRPITVSGGRNLKQDLALPFVPPPLAGPATAPVGRDTAYQPGVVPGADSYDWESHRLVPFAATFGAEGGQPGLRIEATAGYDVVQGAVRDSGTRAYRLVHFVPDGADRWEDQRLVLTNRFHGTSGTRIRFRSLLGYATRFQTAILEWSADEGRTWTGAWSRSGAGETAPTQQAFETVSVDLPGLAGTAFEVRFRFALGAGPFFADPVSTVGWFVDSIDVLGASEAVRHAGGRIAAGDAVRFRPTVEGPFLARVRPLASGRVLPFGPWLPIAAVPAATGAEVAFEAARIDAGTVVLEFGIAGTTVTSVVLESAAGPSGPWEPVAAASPEIVGEGRGAFRIPATSGTRMFRARLP